MSRIKILHYILHQQRKSSCQMRPGELLARGWQDSVPLPDDHGAAQALYETVGCLVVIWKSFMAFSDVSRQKILREVKKNWRNVHPTCHEVCTLQANRPWGWSNRKGIIINAGACITLRSGVMLEKEGLTGAMGFLESWLQEQRCRSQ